MPRPPHRNLWARLQQNARDFFAKIGVSQSRLSPITRREIIKLSAIAAGVLLSLVILCLLSIPRIGDTTYVRDGAPPTDFTFPLMVDTGDQEVFFDVAFSITVPLLAPGRFEVFVDDCVERLSINDVDVSGDDIPFCDYSEGRTVNIGSQLHMGKNAVNLRMRNAGGPAMLQFHPSWSDPLLLGEGILILIVLITYVCALLFLLRAGREAYAMTGLFAGGVFLRAYYALSTPYWIRGHDADGHLDYVRYLATHWSIPAAKDGWEFYHPPLYYFLGSLLQRLAMFMGSEAQAIAWLQFFAFALCVGTLALCIPIARHLFTAREDGRLRLLFVAVMATLPGAVYFAPRINNDVLGQFLAFASFLFILRWWRSGGVLNWYGAIGTIVLHILTKSTGYLLLPVPFLCLLWKRGWSWRQRLRHGVIGLALVVLLTGWLGVYRYMEAEKDTSRFLVGNIGNLNSGLALPNNAAAYLVFNPVGVIRHPYNNAWSDEERRQYFWEYFYRSAFFGEFDLGTEGRLLARYMLLLPMLLIPFAIAGLIVLLRRLRENLPLLLGMGALLAGHTLLRWTSPFSSSQDFRYSLAAMIPILACILYGMRLLPPRLRRVPDFIIVLSVSLSTMFLLAL